MRVEQVKDSLVEASIVRAPSRAPHWVIPTIKTALVVTDSLIAAVSFGAAFYFREGGPIFRQTGGEIGWSARFAPYGALVLFVLVIRVLTLRYYDLYRLRGEFSFFDDGIRVFKSTFFRMRGINLIPTLVVGRGPEAAFCIKEMRERPSLGYRVIGAVDSGAFNSPVHENYEGVPVVSDLAGLPEVIRESGANEVIIADSHVD
jgi:hypothetical protein